MASAACLVYRALCHVPFVGMLKNVTWKAESVSESFFTA